MSTHPGHAPASVRLHLHVELTYRIKDAAADFVFNIHPAHTACQKVSDEQLTVSQPVVSRLEVDPVTGNRHLRMRAEPGELSVAYKATVDLAHVRSDPVLLDEVPIDKLPLHVLSYIYPSRYCESDRFLRIAAEEFGQLPPGHRRVQAIMEWVRAHVDYTSQTSTSRTSSMDTFTERVGVCRDFSHLMIALCRALNIPARFTTGTDYGADPAIGPPDFHAYVEVFLGGRWYVFDPSSMGIPMGFVRIGTGRDAADVSFATIFGNVVPLHAPMVRAVAVEDASQGLVLPYRCEQALSTDGAAHR
jgi:transglutaminase-like putative cysteine protease